MWDASGEKSTSFWTSSHLAAYNILKEKDREGATGT
jgi:hypothetical protein